MLNQNISQLYSFNHASNEGKILLSFQNKIQSQNAINQIFEIKPLKQIHEDLKIENEALFLESYELQYKQSIEENEQKKVKMAANKRIAHENIQKKVQDQKKIENEEMDAKYAQFLSVEEQEEIEKQRKLQEEENKKGELALQLTQEFPHIEIEASYEMLKKKDWQINKVIDELRKIRDRQIQEEKEQEQKILQVMQECNELLDFEQIKKELIRSNWNVQNVIQNQKVKYLIEILLVNCDNNAEFFPLTFMRNQNPEGTEIIEIINGYKNQEYHRQQLFCNIYRDQGKKNCINFMELTNKIENLNLENQPLGQKGPGFQGQPRILYFAMEKQQNEY